MRRVLLPLLLLLLALTGTAHAESADQVASALRNAPVYQSSGLDLVDVPTLTAELRGTDPQVYVAVLPASAASSAKQADERATEIGRALGESDAVVLVITANKHLGAGEGSRAADRGVDADAALQAELASENGAFDKDTITAFVSSFKERVLSQTSSGGSGEGGSSSGGGFPWGPVLLVGAVGGGTAVAVSSRRRKARLNAGLRAEVEQLYSRLANDVGTLDAGDNAVAKQALADAAERYNACGAALAIADSPAQFAAARRTAVEGLTAARVARKELGLDLGPEIPLVPGDGPQLAQDGSVRVAGQDYDGSPTYRPGRQHYFGGGMVGGQQVPGGWYSTPFWEPFLLGSILSGGFGGFGGGGYDRGYEAGVEDARHDSSGWDDSGSGGDWGGSFGDGGGGGDWGGGGDSGGGGDW